ncbi:hypothetical protein [Tepidibacillus fermentans]|uniref:Flagellar protein FliT n=1 Tax=Tepidibacillus fermentans TaxID=1281767 RepID=A0A4R3KKM9_9BACI|nr:hypothetical protein [Tepidibacillus fermentans]TCS83303.1 flagellar protein FliT [Tepidibacillus fermentans]
MNLVEQIYQITIQLYQHLQKEPNKDKREEYIAQIQNYLDQREKLIDELKGKTEYTDEEKELGKKIVGYNQAIDLLLERIYRSIEADVRQTKERKKLHQTYNNPYQGLSVDGMFFDKRK